MHAHRHSGWAGDSKQVSITGAVMHHTNSGGGVAVSDWQRAMALAENKNSFQKATINRWRTARVTVVTAQ